MINVGKNKLFRGNALNYSNLLYFNINNMIKKANFAACFAEN